MGMVQEKIGGEGCQVLLIMDIFLILIVMTVLQIYTYVKMYQVVHFKYVHKMFMLIIPQ